MLPAITVILVLVNLIIWGGLFHIFLPFKFVPLKSFKVYSQRVLNWVGEMWISGNYFISQLLYGIRVETKGLDNPEIAKDKSYVVLCNHQSYADIFVLQSGLNRRIPLLKFFIKKNLIYFPILGTCWWGLDYPFVKRYSKEEIQRNPKLAGKDLENIKKACDKYRFIPVSILSFVEGHRRTPSRLKKLHEPSPYKYLLKPKSGGVSTALTALKDTLNGVLDITIVFPGDVSKLSALISGKIRRIKMFVEYIPLSKVPFEAQIENAKSSVKMQEWLNERWAVKDKIIVAELSGTAEAVAEAGV